jgi:hypothetical protein
LILFVRIAEVVIATPRGTGAKCFVERALKLVPDLRNR